MLRPTATLLVLLASLTACETTTTDLPDASSAARCPDTAPTVDDPCTDLGLQCTYVEPGTDGLRCAEREALYCNGTRWLADEDPYCNAEGCPAGPMEGASCAGESCAYADGTVCVCVACLPSGSDGGACDRASTMRCRGPSTEEGCPTQVPPSGSACDDEGLVCSWGDEYPYCSVWPVVECRGGAWQPTEGGCA